MIADNFEELVSKCVLSGFPHRLLYVFVRAAFMDEGDEEAEVVQVLSDAHQPAQPGLTFADVRATADAQSPDWNIIVVGIAKNSDASRPSDEQAAAFLADMREKILVGDIADFSLLDRDGQPLEIETEIRDEAETDSGQPLPQIH
ncbi:MAG: hypothetical protein HQ513_01245 [Rhodospirillales bacterium]|nr:hypothetical protein [Rhodospirillales bacterium]